MFKSLYSAGFIVGVAVQSAWAVDPYFHWDFSDGPQGWTSVDVPFRTHVANPVRGTAPVDINNGQPAWSLRLGDLHPNAGIATPTSYAGNIAWAYNRSVLSQIYVRVADEVVYPDIHINCGTDSLYTENFWSGATNAWRTSTSRLREFGTKGDGLDIPFRLASTGQPATRQQFLSLLTHVTAIYFVTEWSSTPSDDTNIDEIYLPRPLRTGDANKDLTVNFSDLLIVAQNYGRIYAPNATPDQTWELGDTNGDNAVNFTDLLALAQNYGSIVTAAPTSPSADFAGDWALAQSLVPEPSTAIPTIASLAALRRRGVVRLPSAT